MCTTLCLVQVMSGKNADKNQQCSETIWFQENSGKVYADSPDREKNTDDSTISVHRNCSPQGTARGGSKGIIEDIGERIPSQCPGLHRANTRPRVAIAESQSIIYTINETSWNPASPCGSHPLISISNIRELRQRRIKWFFKATGPVGSRIGVRYPFTSFNTLSVFVGVEVL